jgi:hypothetical protein
MAIITYGTSQLEGNASFRIPLGLFFVVPSIVGVSIFFIPEVRIYTPSPTPPFLFPLCLS